MTVTRDDPALRELSVALLEDEGFDVRSAADGRQALAVLATWPADVVLLEARAIGGAVSGNTTAKLSALHGLTYDSIRSSHDPATARAYAELNQRGVERVREIAGEQLDVGLDRAAVNHGGRRAELLVDRLGLGDELASLREASGLCM